MPCRRIDQFEGVARFYALLEGGQRYDRVDRILQSVAFRERRPINLSNARFAVEGAGPEVL